MGLPPGFVSHHSHMKQPLSALIGHLSPSSGVFMKIYGGCEYSYIQTYTYTHSPHTYMLNTHGGKHSCMHMCTHIHTI